MKRDLYFEIEGGLKESNPNINIKSESEEIHHVISVLNDNGHIFNQIADLIEEQL